MRYGRVDAPVPSKSTSAPLMSSLSKKGPVYPSSRLSTTSSASSSYTHHTSANNNNNSNSAYTPIPPECFASRLPVPLPPYPDDVPTPGIYKFMCISVVRVYMPCVYIYIYIYASRLL